MNRKILIVIASVVLLVFALLPAVIFLTNFAATPFSNDIANWGQTGDYFGGFLNPIVGFASLVITTYIAVELHDLNSKLGEREIETQRLILKRQIQFQVIHDYNAALSRLLDEILQTEQLYKPENLLLLQTNIIGLKKAALSTYDFYQWWQRYNEILGKVDQKG